MGELIDKTKGEIKQAVGGLIGNKKMVRDGKMDVIKGRIKGAVHDVKDAAKDAKRSVDEAIADD